METSKEVGKCGRHLVVVVLLLEGGQRRSIAPRSQ